MDIKIKLFFTTFVMLLFIVPAVTAEQAVGKIFFASGDAKVVRANGMTQGIEKNDLVFNADLLKTGDGLLQVKFDDGGLMSLQKHSEMRVDNYRYEGSENGNESAIFSLIRGGLRAISGAIGHKRPARYQLRTSVATIGIRGTAYSALLCNQDCGAIQGRTLEDGLHAKTTEGTIFVKNDGGSIDVPAGKAAFVPDLSTIPTYTEFNPSFAVILPSSKTKEAKVVGAQGKQTVAVAAKPDVVAQAPRRVAPAVKTLSENRITDARIVNFDRFASSGLRTLNNTEVSRVVPAANLNPSIGSQLNKLDPQVSTRPELNNDLGKLTPVSVDRVTTLETIPVAPSISETLPEVLSNTNNLSLDNSVKGLTAPLTNTLEVNTVLPTNNLTSPLLR